MSGGTPIDQIVQVALSKLERPYLGISHKKDAGSIQSGWSRMATGRPNVGSTLRS